MIDVKNDSFIWLSHKHTHTHSEGEDSAGGLIDKVLMDKSRACLGLTSFLSAFLSTLHLPLVMKYTHDSSWNGVPKVRSNQRRNYDYVFVRSSLTVLFQYHLQVLTSMYTRVQDIKR